MPSLLIPLVLFLLSGIAVALLSFLLHPIWQPSIVALGKFAELIVGAFSGLEDGAKDLQRCLRGELRKATESTLYGDGPGRAPGWPWRAVVKPFLSLVICITLLLIETDVGAYGWQVVFGTGAVPNLHLPLSLLMGLMLPLAGIAFADALFDVLDPFPTGPWSSFQAAGRRRLAWFLAAVLLVGVLANVGFFLWRGGQLQAVNPYGFLIPVISGVLGALLFLAPVFAGAIGARFITLLVPAALTVACGVLLAVQKAAEIAGIVIKSVGAAGEFILTCLNALGEMIKDITKAIADALSQAIRASAKRRGAKAPRRGFGSSLGSAVVGATRSFWSLLVACIFGIGRACRAVGRAIRISAVGIARAVRAVALAVGAAVAAVARAIAICAVALARGALFTGRILGHAGVALVRPVVLLLVAIAIWLFYWPSRILGSFFGWLCRFDFWTKRMHFKEPTNPPPKEKMDWRLNNLAKLDPHASGIILSAFEPSPPSSLEKESRAAAHG
jgi:hypothetical protein